MTLKEKIRMMRGHAMGVTIKNVFTRGRYYNGEAYPAGGCKRLGIPPVLFTDGPRGIVMGKCTCFPVSMLRGATFDDDLEYEVGKVFAKEASALGANLYAGVCINLLRHPKWGRAQETYDEDPFLLGKMGVALTKAMQENGIIACPKHYALNSIEDLPFSFVFSIKYWQTLCFNVYNVASLIFCMELYVYLHNARSTYCLKLLSFSNQVKYSSRPISSVTTSPRPSTRLKKGFLSKCSNSPKNCPFLYVDM